MENIRNWLESIDVKEKALWLYDKTLEILLILCIALAIVFVSLIEFLRQPDLEWLSKWQSQNPLRNPFKNNSAKEK